MVMPSHHFTPFLLSLCFSILLYEMYFQKKTWVPEEKYIRYSWQYTKRKTTTSSPLRGCVKKIDWGVDSITEWRGEEAWAVDFIFRIIKRKKESMCTSMLCVYVCVCICVYVSEHVSPLARHSSCSLSFYL